MWPSVKCGNCGATYTDRPEAAAYMNHECKVVPQHVYPLGDLVDHDTSGKPCICGPRVEEGGLVVVHHSLDGRENHE